MGPSSAATTVSQRGAELPHPVGRPSLTITQLQVQPDFWQGTFLLTAVGFQGTFLHSWMYNLTSQQVRISFPPEPKVYKIPSFHSIGYSLTSRQSGYLSSHRYFISTTVEVVWLSTIVFLSLQSCNTCRYSQTSDNPFTFRAVTLADRHSVYYVDTGIRILVLMVVNQALLIAETHLQLQYWLQMKFSHTNVQKSLLIW